ncbi:MAG: hypothetical protein RI911_177 [Candidatus Parcubacteria bacterium]|jgi:very-short-patch-repair endonuclease
MLLTLVALIIGIALIIKAIRPDILEDLDIRTKPKYGYIKKQYFMTKAENELFQILSKEFSGEYVVFAQVHLPTIINHKIKGQNWKAALSSVDRKSVDFVLCDKTYLSPKLAIELDDKSHEEEDRKERDRFVEQVLESAGMPLLRIKNKGFFDVAEVVEMVRKGVRDASV